MRGLTLWPTLLIAISVCDLVHAKSYRLQDVPKCAVSLPIVSNEILIFLTSPDQLS